MKNKLRSIVATSRRAVNKILRTLSNRGVVLLYHRVAEIEPDPQLLCVTPSHFKEHLQVLGDCYYPLSLRELGLSIEKRQIRQNSVVVTFDDGYADNLWHAAPLLEKDNIPGTIFVTSGLVGKTEETISDTLERIFLSSKSLPEVLAVPIDGKPYKWFLDNSPPNLGPWNITSEYDPSPRYRCYRDFHRILRPMSAKQREDILSELVAWSGCPPVGRRERLTMDADELLQINHSGLIEIGSHGVNHLMMSKQALIDQEFELNSSKRELEEILGCPVTSFAYPYGGRDTVNSETMRLVRKQGYALACDNVPGAVKPRSNVYTIPRFLVRNWNGDEFAKRLRMAFLD